MLTLVSGFKPLDIRRCSVYQNITLSQRRNNKVFPKYIGTKGKHAHPWFQDVSYSCQISLHQLKLNIARTKIFSKHQINWNKSITTNVLSAFEKATLPTGKWLGIFPSIWLVHLSWHIPPLSLSRGKCRVTKQEKGKRSNLQWGSE